MIAINVDLEHVRLELVVGHHNRAVVDDFAFDIFLETQKRTRRAARGSNRIGSVV